MPPVAAGFVAVVLVAALLAVLPLCPALRTALPWGVLLGGDPARPDPGEWSRVAVLALLYAGCDRLARGRGSGGGVRARGAEPAPDPFQGPWAAYFPVLLAGVVLLPPSAAALVALPGALLAPAEPPRTTRRVWNAAQLGLASCTAACVFHALGGTGQPELTRFPGVLLPAGAAALTFCAVNGLLVGGILAAAEPGTHHRLWSHVLLRCPGPALGHGLIGLMMAVLWAGPYGVFAAVLLLLPLTVSTWVFAQYHLEHAAHQATVRALVQAVEIKDEYTREHSERVGRAAVLIARELRMREDRVASLRVAGTLHDVGKLGVPTRVLRKDGPLTDDEYQAVALHPEYGHEMVRGIGFLGEARDGILHHHERVDGRGYPHGLAGDAIPEFARVIAVADAFDSMTSTRPYRRGRPLNEAVAELERCAGSQFDPAMVDALVRALDRHGWEPVVAGDASAPDIPLGPREPSVRSAAGGSGRPIGAQRDPAGQRRGAACGRPPRADPLRDDPLRAESLRAESLRGDPLRDQPAREQR
ncbi:HD-GYP domain-containing protein [Streptacidiphilus sp. EB129]|uniref:HD-GYP domain-containing protein n=1 Tax=Streptacidiphilus sp. EB129 TaxID=3156262 RepID=UPI003519B980